MDPELAREAVAEAERFIRYANKMLAAAEERGDTVLFGSKESGACRRASLDLTRALAELRNTKFGHYPEAP